MLPLTASWNQPHSQRSQLVGMLDEKDEHGNPISSQEIYAHQEIIVGRDAIRWYQHAVDDVLVSNKHLRIYTVIFDEDQTDGVAPLVYAEDLSRNGAYWNGSLIGKGNGGVLLSDGDSVSISPRIQFQFRQIGSPNKQPEVDPMQEREMEYFCKDYLVSARKLGSGAWGQVFMAVEQSNKTQVACKIVDLRKAKALPRPDVARCQLLPAREDAENHRRADDNKPEEGQMQQKTRFRQQQELHHREATILASLNHPNIIGIRKVYITEISIYIFQDLLTGGDLFSFLERRNGQLSDVETAVIVRQILIALEYLHDHGIVHRDLKPENVLMTSLATGCRIVLTDFGHAKKVHSPHTRMKTMAGTEQYTAPEIAGTSRHFNGEKGYTNAVDMWSLGCVTVVLLTGGSPFVDQTTNRYCQVLAQQCDLQQLDKAVEWRLIGRRPKDFVSRLLVLNEEQRLSAKDAKNHHWFSNEFHKVDFEEAYQRATRHWKPRASDRPIIETLNSHKLKSLHTVRDGGFQSHCIAYPRHILSNTAVYKSHHQAIRDLPSLKRKLSRLETLGQSEVVAKSNAPLAGMLISQLDPKAEDSQGTTRYSDTDDPEQRTKPGPEPDLLRRSRPLCLSKHTGRRCGPTISCQETTMRDQRDDCPTAVHEEHPAVPNDRLSSPISAIVAKADGSGCSKKERGSRKEWTTCFSVHPISSLQAAPSAQQTIGEGASTIPAEQERNSDLENRNAAAAVPLVSPRAKSLKGRNTDVDMKKSYDIHNTDQALRYSEWLEELASPARLGSSGENLVTQRPKEALSYTGRSRQVHQTEQENTALLRYGCSKLPLYGSQSSAYCGRAEGKRQAHHNIEQIYDEAKKQNRTKTGSKARLWKIADGFSELDGPR